MTCFCCVTMLALVKIRTVPSAEQVIMVCFVVLVAVSGEFAVKASNGRNSDCRIIGSS